MPSDFELKSQIIEALDAVQSLTPDVNLLDARMVEKVEVTQGAAAVTIVFEDDVDKKDRWGVEDALADAVEAVEGVTDVDIIGLTRSGFEGKATPMPQSTPTPAPSGPPPGNPSNIPETRPLEGVGKVIAVAKEKDGKTKLKTEDSKLLWKIKVTDTKVKVSDNEENKGAYVVKRSGDDFKVKRDDKPVGEVSFDGEKIKIKNADGETVFKAKGKKSAALWGVLLMKKIPDGLRYVVMAEIGSRGR